MSDFRHPKPLTPIQIELLESVKPAILATAEMFAMEIAFNDECSPACIAGHCAIRLGFKERGTISVLIKAEAYFGIKEGEGDMPLFYLRHWDEDLRDEYEGAIHPDDIADSGIQAIDRYIKNTRAHFANKSEA